jgi:hypothetical protein
MTLRATAAKIFRDWPLLAALGICLVATALRIPPLRESLWLDELHTAWCALGPLDEVARRAAIGNQGPLFYWLEWLLANALGPSELSFRLISLISGSLLPLALFLFARRWSFITAGLVAAALIAFDSLSIFYATEARPYALLQLLTVTHLAIAAEISKSTTYRLRVAWIALGTAMFYVHFTAAILIAVEASFLFFARLMQIRRSIAEGIVIGRNIGISDALIDVTIVGGLCLPQLANLRHVFAHRANWAIFVEKEPLWIALDWTPLPPWLWAGLLVLAVAAIARNLANKQSNNGLSGASIWLLTVWSFVAPIAIAWLATRADFTRLFFPRYLAGALPAAALCAGLCVGSLRSHAMRVIAALATITIAVWNGGAIQQFALDGHVIAPRNEDWRGSIHWLNQHIQDDGYPILVYSGLIEADELSQPHDPLLDEFCLSPVSSLYPLDAAPSDLFPLTYHNPGHLSQAAEQLILHRNGCSLIVRGNKDIAEAVATQIGKNLNSPPSAIEGSQFTMHSLQSFGKVQVVRIANSRP